MWFDVHFTCGQRLTVSADTYDAAAFAAQCQAWAVTWHWLPVEYVCRIKGAA